MRTQPWDFWAGIFASVPNIFVEIFLIEVVREAAERHIFIPVRRRLIGEGMLLLLERNRFEKDGGPVSSGAVK